MVENAFFLSLKQNVIRNLYIILLKDTMSYSIGDRVPCASCNFHKDPGKVFFTTTKNSQLKDPICERCDLKLSNLLSNSSSLDEEWNDEISSEEGYSEVFIVIIK